MRRAQRVLAMVHELHKRGYQRIRIAPGMSGSGVHWRCAVLPKSEVLRSHGALAVDPSHAFAARYTSAQDNGYFEWNDAHADTARELADKFLVRFPEICSAGRGADWEYAGWYVEMLGFAENGDLPVGYADWYEDQPPRWLATTTLRQGLPMPPPGEADPRPDSFDTA